ncbi:MAG: sulfurtransferase TusA family protein [Rhodocyclaceae bacterium]|nr:sulfurtransferase TusA family protein [Rhodocyclaceae bacterium]
MNFDKELDAKGLNCPLPILRTKKSLTDMTSGQILKILSTDPGSVKDMAAFCKQTGNELVTQTEAGGEYQFYVKRK